MKETFSVKQTTDTCGLVHYYVINEAGVNCGHGPFFQQEHASAWANVMNSWADRVERLQVVIKRLIHHGKNLDTYNETPDQQLAVEKFDIAVELAKEELNRK